MDNWGIGNMDEGKEMPTASSAYEWVTSHPDHPETLFFTTDEAWGMGFATFDLNQKQS